MAKEIEKKFLVDVNSEFIKNLKKSKGILIQQGYLNQDITKTIRVRTKDNKGYITIKGKQIGITKPEYEYEIPLQDAKELLLMCEIKLEKIRYEFKSEDNLIWEIDFFKGSNEGLIIAELELEKETQNFKKPSWIKEDISTDFRFSNLNLAK